MKNLIALVSLSIFTTGQLAAQSWSQVNDYNPQALQDVAFASASVGIIAGQQGQVYRTIDGGITWSFLDLGTTENLKAAYFADVNHGFILGNGLYQTTNSGVTWAAMTGPGLPVEGICFVDNQHGTVVGANGVIFHTTNGGSSWMGQTSNTSNALKGVWFTSENNGIVVGEAGLILQTSDGGSSWNRYLSGTLQDLNSIFFLNATTGFISGGSGTILRTTDGGQTWFPALVEPTAVSLLKVKMLDAANGFTFGNSSNFMVPIEFFRTTDGGATWSRQSYGQNRAVRFYGMAVIDPRRCAIVGSPGTVMRTTDGGTTWQSQELLPEPGLLCVTGPFTGVLTRSLLAAGSAGFSFESSDGGAWVLNRYASRTIRAIAGAGTSLTSNTSIMVGDAGTVVVSNANQNVGSRSTAQLKSDLDLRGVCMVDRDTAYVVADSGYIFKSTDRGATWAPCSSGTGVALNAVSFADAMDGFAVGEGGLIKRTTDYGRNWSAGIRLVPSRLNAISFASPNVGLIVGAGGTILRTSNGGNTWLLRPGPVGVELHAVVFANPARALAVGDGGRIIGSNDGGLTWQIQPSPVTANLRGVAFLNDTLAVAVGDKQTIVQTTDGVTWVGDDGNRNLPTEFGLEQNYPNPFNPITTIKYTVGVASGLWQVASGAGAGEAETKEAGTGNWELGTRKTMLVVYDVLGRQVAVLVDEAKAPGNYQVQFDGSGLASGVYVYRLTAGAFIQSRKMVLLK